jgi:hypothetical protein
MSLQFDIFAKNKYFVNQSLQIPNENILLKAGNTLYDAFQIYLYKYQKNEYTKLFPISFFYPTVDFTSDEKNFFSKVIDNSDKTKKWLAMQYFYFINKSDSDQIGSLFDDGINFFNWITNKNQSEPILIPPFQKLIEKSLQVGGKLYYKNKLKKYHNKIIKLHLYS